MHWDSSHPEVTMFQCQAVEEQGTTVSLLVLPELQLFNVSYIDGLLRI